VRPVCYTVIAKNEAERAGRVEIPIRWLLIGLVLVHLRI
jgi:hypothetical protein